jgi:hypothetical protein
LRLIFPCCPIRSGGLPAIEHRLEFRVQLTRVKRGDRLVLIGWRSALLQAHPVSSNECWVVARRRSGRYSACPARVSAALAEAGLVTH